MNRSNYIVITVRHFNINNINNKSHNINKIENQNLTKPINIDDVFRNDWQNTIDISVENTISLTKTNDILISITNNIQLTKIRNLKVLQKF